MTRRGAIILAACGALLAGAWWYVGRVPSPRTSGASLRDLLPAIAEGQSEAASRAREAAARDWPGSLPTVAGMLSAYPWRLRAVACEIVAARADANLAVLLIPRASDADWRVRAAAFEALASFRPFGHATPMMNTPLAQREETLLAWIDDRDARSSADAVPWRRELCEVYAGAAHVEFGRPLIDRCLQCHAGAAPQPFESSAACERCHPAIYRQWAGSAHANSLSHLRLVTVDANTRSPQAVDFGAVKGIACTECHRLDRPGPAPAASSASASTAGASRPAACPYAFAAAQPAGDSCARCHASTNEEWRSWQSRPHPMRLDWPPGQIDMEAGGDRRTCVECHMRPRGLYEAQRRKDHSWAARRDIAFLREGLDLRVASAGAKGDTSAVPLKLTNLAGHDYPTGSRRRALRLYAGPEGAPEGAPLATLSPPRPGQLFLDAQRSLAPGESRLLPATLPAGAAQVAYRLRYFRDLADPNAYAADVLAAEEPVDR